MKNKNSRENARPRSDSHSAFSNSSHAAVFEGLVSKDHANYDTTVTVAPLKRNLKKPGGIKIMKFGMKESLFLGASKKVNFPHFLGVNIWVSTQK